MSPLIIWYPDVWVIIYIGTDSSTNDIRGDHMGTTKHPRSCLIYLLTFASSWEPRGIGIWQYMILPVPIVRFCSGPIWPPYFYWWQKIDNRTSHTIWDDGASSISSIIPNCMYDYQFLLPLNMKAQSSSTKILIKIPTLSLDSAVLIFTCLQFYTVLFRWDCISFLTALSSGRRDLCWRKTITWHCLKWSM